MVEVLKQDQFRPLPVEKQVVIIYAGNRGFLDPLPVAAVARYERELYEFLDSRHAKLLKGIRERGEMTDEIKSGLDAALSAFGEKFAASVKKG